MAFVPPWVIVAAVFALTTYFQDVAEIARLSCGAVLGRDTGCELCHKTTALLFRVAELDEADNIG